MMSANWRDVWASEFLLLLLCRKEIWTRRRCLSALSISVCSPDVFIITIVSRLAQTFWPPGGGGAANPIYVRSVEPATTYRQIYEYFS